MIEKNDGFLFANVGNTVMARCLPLNFHLTVLFGNGSGIKMRRTSRDVWNIILRGRHPEDIPLRFAELEISSAPACGASFRPSRMHGQTGFSADGTGRQHIGLELSQI
jgi:hypothetical protein